MAKTYKEKDSESRFWMSMSDIMSVLMMMFLLISVSYMIKVSKEKDKIVDAAQKHDVIKKELYHELEEEFKNNLAGWSASIDSTLLFFRFSSPDFIFKAGQSKIQERFEKILNNFFPRYVNLIMQDKYIGYITEIGIEAYSSDEWPNEKVPIKKKYFKTIKLSQDRTLNILKYILSHLTSGKTEKWLLEKLASTGLSHTREMNEEHHDNIRSIDFIIRIDAEQSIHDILNIKEEQVQAEKDRLEKSKRRLEKFKSLFKRKKEEKKNEK